MDSQQVRPVSELHPPSTFIEHVHELRYRVLITALAFFVGGVLGYIFHAPIIRLIEKPLHETLYYGSPAGGFNFVMRICVLTGVLVALPVLIHNLVSFIQPALGDSIIKKNIRRYTTLSAILALAGVAFAFLIIVPMSLKFFSGFQVNGIQALITTDSYLSFIINSLLTFAIIFQIPIVMTFIDRIKPMPPKQLLKYEKYVIVGALAVAVFLPFTYDPITQFVVAIPIIVLYNLSIVFIYLFRYRHQPTPAPTPVQTPTPIPAFQPAEAITTEIPKAPIPVENSPRLIEDIVRPQKQIGLTA